MKELYSDIINVLEVEDTIDFKKQQKNKEYKKIVDLVKELLKLVYIEELIIFKKANTNIGRKINENLETIKISKKVVIKKIKQEIESFSEKYHIKIKEILKDEEIQSHELDFAMKLIYNDEQTYKEIDRIRNYKEQHDKISDIEQLIGHINDTKTQLTTILKEIAQIRKKNKKPSKLRIIKYIKWAKQNKKDNKEIEELKQEIIQIIRKSNQGRQDYILKEYCFKNLTNITELYEELKNLKPEELTREKSLYIKQQLELGYKESIKYIKEELKTKKQEIIEVRLNSKLRQGQINNIVYANHNNYAWHIIQDRNLNKKTIKETMLAKIIFVLKLVELIEHNKINTEELTQAKQITKK